MLHLSEDGGLWNEYANPHTARGLRLLVTQFGQQQFTVSLIPLRPVPANWAARHFYRKNPLRRLSSEPYYTGNSMHNLKAERFHKHEMTNGMMMAHDGPMKTFTLRGINDSSPYLHDGPFLTLGDTVEYFNLIH